MEFRENERQTERERGIKIVIDGIQREREKERKKERKKERESQSH